MELEVLVIHGHPLTTSERAACPRLPLSTATPQPLHPHSPYSWPAASSTSRTTDSWPT